MVDVPFGFANALKAAFVSAVSELSHLAVFGLEGSRDALHDTLRARLVCDVAFGSVVTVLCQ